MDLPVQPPVEPMLAKAQAKVPDDAGVWSYEPKWDGFRALVFRDGDDVVLQSRNGKDLGRYFPELLDALRDETSTAVRARRRGRGSARDRRPYPAGLGVAQPADPSRRKPDQDAGRADAGALHRFRRARHRRHVIDGRAVPGPSGSVVGRGHRKDSGAMSPAPPRIPSWVRGG